MKLTLKLCLIYKITYSANLGNCKKYNYILLKLKKRLGIAFESLFQVLKSQSVKYL